jgi:hypothetical protein
MSAASARVRPLAVAVTDEGGEYEYPDEVEYEIRQGTKGDYARAAELINYKDVRWLSLQHEYGIFGGDDGAYILDLLSALRVPAIVTLHTVLDQPSESQRKIVQRIAKSAPLVVMSRVGRRPARAALRRGGRARARRPARHPGHAAPRSRRPQGGVRHRRSPHAPDVRAARAEQGIETVIRRCPPQSPPVPTSFTSSSGPLTPAVLRQYGEAYRTTLEREAERLGVRDHVVFRDQYVTTDELCRYLQAADIFVSPYLNEAQVTSGALSYAMGAGAAVISTPYWHARELLARGAAACSRLAIARAWRGRSSPSFKPRRSSEALRERGYEYTRGFTWPRIGAAYVELGAALPANAADDFTSASSRGQQPARAAARSRLRLTDDTGIVQHATFSVPARESGLLRRRQRARSHRRPARGSPDRVTRGQAARLDLSRVPPRRPDRGRLFQEPHEVRPFVW